MLKINAAIGSFAVNDVEAAQEFYGSKLGLELTSGLPGRSSGPLWLRAGDGPGVFIYPKRDHVPAGFTVLNLSVPDIAEAVDELTARGVVFEQYPEIPQDERGIYHGEGHAIAWFIDPAGNSLSVVELSPAT